MIFKNKYRQFTITVISLLFIVLFVYAALSKLLHFETFTLQLAQSPLLSAYAGVIAFLVPGLEIGIAILLVFERWRTLALYASFTLMVMFTAYIFFILNFSDFVPCSCGGVLEKLSWTQHLIFNVVFIILAGVAVFFAGPYRIKKTLLLLVTLAIIGISIVALLFAFSEKKMHRNNAFVRRYIPHAITARKIYDLKYNSWYIAGINSGKVYLGNVTVPLRILILDTLLGRADTIQVELDNMDLPYKAVTLSVGKTEFYASDGTVPIVLRGSKGDWKAKTNGQDHYFTAAAPMDSSGMAIRIANARTLKNEIGIIDLGDRKKVDTLQTYELPAAGDGIFESDGQLMWNGQLEELVYIYFYSNRYFLISPSLEIFERHTIDTVTEPSLDILHFKTLGKDKLKGNATRINEYASTYGNFLFIKSGRLGRYEKKKILEDASIIDVYDISRDEYKFSFYIYNQDDRKLTAFKVVRDKIYAIMEDRLVTFSLNEVIERNLRTD